LVSVSHVLWTTGARLPVERIARLARDRGAMVVVDGAQAVGAIPVAVESIGADFYAVPSQKWLLGPEGTGALWASDRAIESAAQSTTGWYSFEQLQLDGSAAYHRDARRFEGSNYHKPSVVGFARSCGWLSMYVGLPWVHERGQRLARAAADRLAEIHGVEVLTPRERMATLVSFRIRGWTPAEALDELGARVFAIARTVPQIDAIRISVGFFNTEEEIERLAGAVALLASHTPETIPARKRLVILGQDDA
jgi:L-cysteine/cystine lyase